MDHYVVVGADRGLGLALARKALSLDHKVTCVCRNPDGARELWELESEYGSCQLVGLDEIYSGFRLEPIDTVVHHIDFPCAGDLRLENVNLDHLGKCFHGYVIESMRMIRLILPLFKKSATPMLALLHHLNSSKDEYSSLMIEGSLKALICCLAGEYKSLLSVLLRYSGTTENEHSLTEMWYCAENVYKMLSGLSIQDSGRIFDL